MIINPCNLCPNQCNIDRTKYYGRCGAKDVVRIARAELHFWEEPFISGQKGSGAIFFSGCNVGCVFCQNYEISANLKGKEITVDGLVDEIKKLEDKGALNINFVTPTHYAYAIIEALNKYKPKIPIVYNTSSYEKVETLKELDGAIDVYLPDFKFLSSDLSLRYCGKSDYPQVALAAIKEMYRQTGKIKIENDLIKSGTVIRHLVLPACTHDSVNIIKTLYEIFGENVWYSVMSQYFPTAKSKDYPPLDRRLKELEYKTVIATVLKLGIENCFYQELTSANEEYVPEFFGEYPKELK